MYKAKFKHLPQRIYDLFTLITSPYNIRNADFILPRFSIVLLLLESTPFAIQDPNYATFIWSKKYLIPKAIYN